MVGFASVLVEESLKMINERRIEVKGVESAFLGVIWVLCVVFL